MYAWNSFSNKRGPFRATIPRTIAREIRDRVEEQENLAKQHSRNHHHQRPPAGQYSNYGHHPRPSVPPPYPVRSLPQPPLRPSASEGRRRSSNSSRIRQSHDKGCLCQIGSVVRAVICLALMLGVTGGLVYWVTTAHFTSVIRERMTGKAVRNVTRLDQSLEESALSLDKSVRLYIDYDGKLHRLSELSEHTEVLSETKTALTNHSTNPVTPPVDNLETSSLPVTASTTVNRQETTAENVSVKSQISLFTTTSNPLIQSILLEQDEVETHVLDEDENSVDVSTIFEDTEDVTSDFDTTTTDQCKK